MDFLSTGKWWIFLVLASLSYFISSIGHHGRGTLSPKIEAVGSAIMTIFVILTFVFSGWKGGIGVIIALLIWVIIAEKILWLLFRKLMPNANNLNYNQFIKRSRFHSSSSKRPSSVKELLEYSERNKRIDEALLKISNQPEFIKVLQKYGKNQEYIINIYHTLLGAGSGEYIAQSVIENSELLSEYLQMEADGVSELKIAYKFSEILGGS